MQSTLTTIALAAGLAFGPSARAAWPDDKPIELIVGFAPGGGTDAMARTLARFLEPRLGKGARIIVLNKPGGGGEIAASHVQQAKPDGYTLGMVNVPGFVFLPMYRKTAYQPEEIRLIARLVDDPLVLIAKRNGGKPQTLPAIVQALQSSPNSLSVGHSGDGTTGHLGMRQLGAAAGAHFNSIAYKGSADSKLAVMGGHVDYALITTGEVPEVAQPESTLIGVAQWSASRSANQVATAAEAGYDLKMSSERGIGAPRSLPDHIARQITDGIAQTMKDPAFLEAAKADLPVLAYLPGEEWTLRLQELRKRLQPLVATMAQSK